MKKIFSGILLLILSGSFLWSEPILIVEPDTRTDIAGTSKNWTPYYGPDRISEASFFSLAGNGSDAMKAINYSNKRKKAGWINAGIAVLSIGMVCTPMIAEDMNEGAKIGIAGTGLATGLVAPFLVKGFMGIHGPKYAPYSYASRVAEEYNASH